MLVINFSRRVTSVIILILAYRIYELTKLFQLILVQWPLFIKNKNKKKVLNSDFLRECVVKKLEFFFGLRA